MSPARLGSQPPYAGLALKPIIAQHGLQVPNVLEATDWLLVLQRSQECAYSDSEAQAELELDLRAAEWTMSPSRRPSITEQGSARQEDMKRERVKDGCIHFPAICPNRTRIPTQGGKKKRAKKGRETK